MKIDINQESFTGGELAPALFGRTDIAQYANACATLENFLIRPYGAIVSCPGTEFINDAKFTFIPTSDINDLNLKDEDFTIEFFVNFNSIDTVGNHENTIMALGLTEDNVHNSWRVSLFDNFAASNSTIAFYYNVNATYNAQLKNWTPSLDTWYHWAIVRSSSSLYLYVDGSSIGWNSGNPYNIGTDYIKDTTDNNATGGFHIGGNPATAGDLTPRLFLDGWLDEIRISNIARYTAAFTPSTTAFVSDANTKFLMHGADFSDDTTFNILETHGTVSIDTAFSKINGSSIKFATSNAFTGPGGYLKIAHTYTGATIRTYGKSRLVPFIFSRSDAYVVEVGESYFRFYNNGAVVTT